MSLTWNKIPLPCERPEVKELAPHELELSVADYLGKLLQNFGVIETVALADRRGLYSFLELPPLKLLEGTLYVGQLPMVRNEVVTEQLSFSVAASAERRSPLQVAVRTLCLGTPDAVVDENGEPLDYDDLLEVTAALKVLDRDLFEEWERCEPPHDLQVFPFPGDMSLECHSGFRVRYCLKHE